MKSNPNDIHFEKAAPQHQDMILQWLSEPHMMEFWDNSQGHKDDILNFIHGRKQTYFYGSTEYRVGYYKNEPFAFILSDIILPNQVEDNEIQKQYLSKEGHTISLDFGIGNKHFLGKGLAAPTLIAFVNYYHEQLDPKADTFFIDPDANNPRAKHVYAKAGFQEVGSYDMGNGVFTGQKTFLMIKKINS